MHILFPGRHHLLTDFQFKYIYTLLETNLFECKDINGDNIDGKQKITDIIFAVTSSNHSNTRRNPLPFYLRAMALHDFCDEFNIPVYVVGIDDVGKIDNFAEYTIKKVEHELDNRFDLTPKNTLVICSTPVLESYQKMGFNILPAELIDKKNYAYQTELPWEIVEKIAYNKSDWKNDKSIIEKIHPSSYLIWKTYNFGEKAKLLFSDSMIGDDGDLTETRDYNSYVRQMDEIAQLKYNETAPFIKKGRIGDIGCAVGSWIKLACGEDKFHESDFYGIEVTRALYDLCIQRKNNKEFDNPNVFFSQKNAVTGLVFQPNSMNTIHTSSLTHEIESYGGREDLLKFIKNRYKELATNGVWINRDVVGPENKEEYVYMKLNREDGFNDDFDKKTSNRNELK
ncbi:MAG TPA: transferase, partial [Spirochaetota bacterium]|nr:transferase [Spirochaetota bacterium]